MKDRKRRLPRVLMALGAVMALCALGMLSQTRNVLQYCVIAPEMDPKGESLKSLTDSARKLGDSHKDALAWTAVGGVAGTVSLSSERTAVEASLYAMGEGWLEVYPRFLVKGRRIGESEIIQGARVIMLDDDLAFSLFGNELPEDAEVRLNDTAFRVVGTVRHAGSLFGGRGVGDRHKFDAYVPLAAAVKSGVALDVLTLSALPNGGSGAAQIFEEAVCDEWLGGGQLILLRKEAMRRTVLPRIALLIAGLYGLVGLFRRMTRMAGGWFNGFREALRRDYFKRLVWRLAGIVALTLLGYGALIGATYLLMAFSAQPLYVFTEWVPENLVEWSSISKTFWSLTEASAGPVRIGTRELRVIEFWGGVLRWGTVLALLGAALRGRTMGEKRA